ncbi:BolA family protein [Microvirga rosea]|uniref:BolA family protein n=1 Tax=Microvirga rosea TaxID=2715425 RepID=UPI001D0BE012|nr:BolA family protein [Microvirga rosea]MCB8818963.1 BolA family transcriptional regulator [Microvirga rosea]
MTLTDWITQELREHLHPTDLVVTDESEQHHGHAGWREGGETHFRLYIVSEAFTGKSRVDRHRIVNTVLKEAFARGLHALAVEARAPGEPDPRASRKA